MQTLVSPLWFHSLALLRLFRSGRAELRLSEMIKGYSVISHGRYNWVFYAVLRTSKQRDERWWEMKATFSELHNLIRDKRGRLIPPLPESKCNINLLLLSPLFCALPLLRYHMCLWMLYKSHEGRFLLRLWALLSSAIYKLQRQLAHTFIVPNKQIWIHQCLICLD